MNEETAKDRPINYEKLWWDLIDVDNCIDEEKLKEVSEKVAECWGGSVEELKNIEDKIHTPLNGKPKSDPPWKEPFDNIINKFSGTPQNAKTFLFVVKYTRAVLLSIPEKPYMSDLMDKLVTCLVTNLNLAGSDRILRLFYLLECAFCAAGEASLGFVSMAKSLYFDLKNEENGIGWLWGVESLLHYNEGLALTHLGHRKEAGISYAIAIKYFKRDFRLAKKNGGSLTDEKDVKRILSYILIPSYLSRADLLLKMQFSVNSILTIQNLERDLNDPEGFLQGKFKFNDFEYHNKKAKLLQILASFDMGEIKKGKENLEECLDDAKRAWINKNRFPCKKQIKDCLKEDKKNENSFILKCYIQFKIEKLKEDIESKGRLPKKDEIRNFFKTLSKISDILCTFIFVYNEDRFTRHNLKELIIDLLEIAKQLFEKANQLLKKNEATEVDIEEISKAVKIIFDGLNTGPRNGKMIRWLREGSLANELWTGDYKIIKSDTRQRLANIMEDLIDEFSEYYKKKERRSKELQKVFCETIDNEMWILGIDKDKKGGLVFAPSLAPDLPEQEKKKLERYADNFPPENTYEARKNLRRARYLVDLMGKVESNKDIKLQHTWLEKELNDGVKEECLISLRDSWKAAMEPSAKVATSDPSVIPLKDYPGIIGESEVVKMFGHGKTRQPVCHHYNGIGEKNGGSMGLQFACLRRWNSFTPEMSYSVGGGYFLFYPENSSDEDKKDHYRKTKVGIVVDPGFDFLHNFFRQGFSLNDIDLILITHGHSDHINDFRTIADLLMERENRPAMGRKGRSKRIFTLMSLNAYPLVKHHIQGEAFRRLYSDTIIVDIDREYNPASITNAIKFEIPTEGELKYLREVQNGTGDTEGGLELCITPVPVSHNDYAETDPYCFGYVIKLRDGKDKNKPKEIATVGFTGDSQWFPELANEFKECQFVCSHMGSLLGDKQENYLGEMLSVGYWEALIRKKNHLYLPGQILFLQQLRAMEVKGGRVIALSEFGEEMKGGLRKDVCDRINLALIEGCWDAFGDGNELPDNKCKPRCNKTDEVKVIPADVGLRISVHKDLPIQVHCALCDEFCPFEDVKTEAFGYEEALFYVCRACYRSKSQDIRWRKYATLLEEGRPVRD